MTNEEMLKIMKDNIKNLVDKTFNVYFFVLDTKGNPNSALEYIYKTAYFLHEEGYKVTMLHQDKEFVGVGEWLGTRYSDLPHANVETDNVTTSPSDFLFIPEIFANVMMQTKTLPCKRVLIVQNYGNITEFLPVSQSLANLNIRDAVVTTEKQAEMIKKYFPEIHTHIVSPSISPIFCKSKEPKNLVVNIVCKDTSVINKMVKPFYWTNPLYKWVSFRDLRGLSQEMFAEALKTGAITIWVDDDTNFGYTLLEALRCGSIVIAKAPDNPTSWMLNKNGDLSENILWFDNIDEIPTLLPSAIRSWTLDNVPEDVYSRQDSFNDLYSEDEQKKEIKKVYIQELFEKRLLDFKETQTYIENNEFEKTEK